MLEARDLGLRTRRGPVFAGVTLTVEPGDLLAITGPAGSGRTSLLLVAFAPAALALTTLVARRYRRLAPRSLHPELVW